MERLALYNDIIKREWEFKVTMHATHIDVCMSIIIKSNERKACSTWAV